MRSNDTPWHREVLGEAAEQTLEELLRARALESFYLAGGTGLALFLGHRRSADLDFFKTGAFDEEALLQRLQQIPGLALVAKGPATLHMVIQEVKTSFLGYDYPVLYPMQSFHGMQVADPRDIAVMKIGGAHHAKGAMLGETLANHFFVARFENVQGQGSAGEQDDVERKQG